MQKKKCKKKKKNIFKKCFLYYIEQHTHKHKTKCQIHTTHKQKKNNK